MQDKFSDAEVLGLFSILSMNGLNRRFAIELRVRDIFRVSLVSKEGLSFFQLIVGNEAHFEHYIYDALKALPAAKELWAESQRSYSDALARGGYEADLPGIHLEYGAALILASTGYKSLDVSKYKLLLRFVSDINCQDKKGYTPLHFAIANDQRSFCDVLLEAVASTTLGNHAGETPMHIAAYENRKSCLKFLSENGARDDIVDNQGRTVASIISSM